MRGGLQPRAENAGQDRMGASLDGDRSGSSATLLAVTARQSGSAWQVARRWRRVGVRRTVDVARPCTTATSCSPASAATPRPGDVVLVGWAARPGQLVGQAAPSVPTATAGGCWATTRSARPTRRTLGPAQVSGRGPRAPLAPPGPAPRVPPRGVCGRHHPHPGDARYRHPVPDRPPRSAAHPRPRPSGGRPARAGPYPWPRCATIRADRTQEEPHDPPERPAADPRRDLRRARGRQARHRARGAAGQRPRPRHRLHARVSRRSAGPSPPSPRSPAATPGPTALVAVVSDGTAVLGLGDIGPRAALPVMEGKSALFKAFGGLDSIPIVLDTTDVDEIVETLVRLRPSFGGGQPGGRRRAALLRAGAAAASRRSTAPSCTTTSTAPRSSCSPPCAGRAPCRAARSRACAWSSPARARRASPARGSCSARACATSSSSTPAACSTRPAAARRRRSRP